MADTIEKGSYQGPTSSHHGDVGPAGRQEQTGGDVAYRGHVFEAMKMEINLNADPHLEGCVVEVFVQPGDTVESGRALIDARRVSPDS